MARKSISEPLRRRPTPTFILRQNQITVVVDNVAEFVSESASLTHGVLTGGNGDERDPTHGISHRQSVLLGRRFNNSDIDSGSLLDEANEIPNRSVPQPVPPAEFLRCLAPKILRTDHQWALGMA